MTNISARSNSFSPYFKNTALKIKSPRKYKTGFESLPFVAGWRSKATAPRWNIPASGGYIGGYETGKAMATALLKFMRADDRNMHGYLPDIVESFACRFEEEGGSEMASRRFDDRSEAYVSLRGQYCGFFNTLADWLADAARLMGSNLDNLSNKELIDCANKGLGFDEEAYFASLDDEEEQ